MCKSERRGRADPILCACLPPTNAYITAAKAPGGKAHATALRAMFGDQSSMIRDMWFTCFVNDPEPKWDALQQNWALFAALDDAALDAAAEKVIDELDAPHLRPIGILERANEGIAPSMHGLKNLLQYMANNLDD